jgi:hypothetical protein
VFIVVYFVVDSVRKLLDTPSCNLIRSFHGLGPLACSDSELTSEMVVTFRHSGETLGLDDSSSLLPKYANIKIYQAVLLPVFCTSLKLGLFHQRNNTDSRC